jgi:predicted helicase
MLTGSSLLRSFDKIFVINLHGNSNINEGSKNAGADENIFDIKQGIALFIGVKTSESANWANVKYAELWGRREDKFKQFQ